MRALHAASAFHRVLLPQLGQHLVDVQAQLCQALLRQFNEQLFFLHTKQFDLGHVGHAQQLLAHVVGKVFQLGLQGVNHAIHITKIVIEKRPLHALRQGVAHIAHALAHLVPDVGHLAGA